MLPSQPSNVLNKYYRYGWALVETWKIKFYCFNRHTCVVKVTSRAVPRTIEMDNLRIFRWYFNELCNTHMKNYLYLRNYCLRKQQESCTTMVRVGCDKKYPLKAKTITKPKKTFAKQKNSFPFVSRRFFARQKAT